MAEELFNYDMAACIEALIQETTLLQVVDPKRISILQLLARESLEMRAAAKEYAVSRLLQITTETLVSLTSESSVSSNESSAVGKLHKSNDPKLDVSELIIQNNKRRNEYYKRAVEHFVENLRAWRMHLEDVHYEHIDFDAPLTQWTRREKRILRNIIFEESYELRKLETVNKVLQCKNNLSARGTKRHKLTIDLIKLLVRDIFVMRVTPYKDMVFPISRGNIYDWEKISKAINQRHTPAECQEFWYTKHHPAINGKAWSEAENRKLVILADAYNLHHWEEVAINMQTNRTGFQCYVQFRRYLYKDLAELLTKYKSYM